MLKKIKVVKIDDKEIFLEEVSRYKSFYDRYGKYLFLLMFLFLIFVGSIVIFSISKTNDYVLDNPDVEIILPDGDNIIVDDNEINNDTNNNVIISKPDDVFDEFFGVPEEISFKIKKIILPDKELYFYSDNTVKVINKNGNIFRVLSHNNNYSVDEKGNINSEAKKSIITIDKVENTIHGKMIYYSDNSVEIENDNMDVWVGKTEYIEDKFITDNKVSFREKTENFSNYLVTYFNDGTLIIDSNNQKYYVRNKEDVIFNNNSFLFNYDNEALIIETKVLDNDFIINFLSDGGATIEKEDNIISVRKSNSIIIENNKLVKIKTNNYVKETSKKTANNIEVIYFDNGSSIIKENNKITGYFPDNSSAKYENNELINKFEFVPLVNTSTPKEDTTINVFEDGMALVEKENNNFFESNNNIVIDGGVVAIINEDDVKINKYNINISNKTSNKVKIRFVIEKGESTTLQNYYLDELKYKVSDENIIKPINNKIWTDNNDEFILYETELNSNEKKEYQLAIWLDYLNLENDAMEKYFYGTLKIYSWEQK